MKEKSDLIVINGLVYTVDSVFSVKQAFAVTDGMIQATGSNEDIMGSFESQLVVDAGGKPVYPGFIDGHCHFYGYALNKHQALDLKGTRSFAEILQKLLDFHKTHPSEWLIGRGWDQNDWETREFPDNSLLDLHFPENPVVLTRIDGHAVLANSVALHHAGITAGTRISGGEVVVKNGRLSGLLVDNAADLMKSFIPGPEKVVKETAMEDAQADCFSYGLTSVTDAGLDFATIRLMDSLQQAGKLNIRINAMLSPTEENIREFVERGTFRKERLSVHSIKLYADGALGSRGALLLEPYSDDPGNYGLLMDSPEYFREILTKAYEKGFQVNTHCIGDSANRMMLNLYGEILKGPNDRRWRIEHAQVIHPDDFQLFGKYHIIPSIQSTHCTSDMSWAEARLGPERVKGAYAYKDLLLQNGWLINGTDFPIEEINPLLTFYAAVARATENGDPSGGYHMENAISREEALRSITIWAAKGSFEEEIKGSIEPGKYADFVILDKDIMTVDQADIPHISVL
ncbi:MAG: amidohydrolase, partial [Bacteroidales bacterium]|nr:amidohydrolase [Bacteroidales bacterium]